LLRKLNKITGTKFVHDWFKSQSSSSFSYILQTYTRKVYNSSWINFFDSAD